jgi:hypothetical protein
VHGDVIGWTDGHHIDGSTALVRLRAAHADGPARTLDFGISGGEGCDSGLELGAPPVDAGQLSWNESCASSVGGGAHRAQALTRRADEAVRERHR